jgi:hypothetical protein
MLCPLVLVIYTGPLASFGITIKVGLQQTLCVSIFAQVNITNPTN